MQRAMERPGEPIPVSVLTGFLGSGKTTLLNHLLASDHGLKVGVIVNEFGSISIDHKLIAKQSDDLIELANGCICCTMAGDLLAALRRILASGADIEHVLVETTGLADPLPIAVTLRQDDVHNLVRLDGIVTVVDADRFDENLDAAEVAYNQLANGDIIVINKIDLVGDEVPDLIERGIRTINPGARMLRCVNARIDPLLLLDADVALRSSEIGNREGVDQPPHDHGHHHGHSDFESFAYVSRTPFDAMRFRQFMDDMPHNVIRAKGVLNLADRTNRFIFHAVGERCTVSESDHWENGEEQASELVFIGRNLDRTHLSKLLESCRVNPRRVKAG